MDDQPAGDNVTAEGVVVLLDALGMRASSLGAATEVLNQFEMFVKNASNDSSVAMRVGESIGLRPSSLEFRIMGDMLALLFPFEIEENGTSRNLQILSCLGYCIHQAVHVFLQALDVNIFFRGAIAYGQFAYSKEGNTIIGPAITDAANWVEMADWIGIHLTPSCGMHIERIMNRDAKNWGCVLYDMPLSSKSNRHSLKCWCCNWPDKFARKLSTIFAKDIPEEVFRDRNRLIDHFTANASFFPIGVESKYLNTLAFFDYCCGTQREREYFSSDLNAQLEGENLTDEPE